VASVNEVIEWLDGFQRHHALFGFPFAVAKKFGDNCREVPGSVIAPINRSWRSWMVSHQSLPGVSPAYLPTGRFK
jgi:hypothetical protein